MSASLIKARRESRLKESRLLEARVFDLIS